MELRIVVTPKLLEEAIVCLMEAKFNVKVAESSLIIAESCNLTESSGVTVNLTTVGESIVTLTAKEPVYEDDDWQRSHPKIVEEHEELRRKIANDCTTNVGLQQTPYNA